MRYILLSADSEPTLYEAPDFIAEHLPDYADAFLDSIHDSASHFWKTVQDPSGASYALLSYNEKDFVAWLNQQDEAKDQPVREPKWLSMEAREIIMETARKERFLPYEQMQYLWFNF